MKGKPLTIKEKNQLENEAVVTDLVSLIDAKIEKRVGKTEMLVISENVKTRQMVERQTELIMQLKSSKINDIIQYALIGGLILLMILTRGCAAC